MATKEGWKGGREGVGKSAIVSTVPVTIMATGRCRWWAEKCAAKNRTAKSKMYS